MRLRPTLLTALAVAVAAVGCGNDDLPDATNPNEVQVDTMGALRSTAVSVPSAFNIASRRSVRTDGGARFDFLYDLDSNGTPTFYPAEAAGVLSPSSTNPGLMKVDIPFDSITIANSNGYILDAPIAIDSGDVFLMRSAIVSCSIGVPYYGKLEVTQIDTVAKKVMFRFLVDENCGYRGLEPGIPEH